MSVQFIHFVLLYLTSFRFLQQGAIPLQHYQLVSSACMLIASKCNMQQLKEVDFTRCSDNTFSTDTLQKMEELILEALEWKLALPSILEFVFAYAQILGVEPDSRELMMMQYLSELALQSQVHLEHKPSLIAAAVIVLSRYVLDANTALWSKNLSEITGFEASTVFACVTSLCRCLEEVRSGLGPGMIQRRYRQPRWQHVAAMEMPPQLSTETLQTFQLAQEQRGIS